VAKAIAAQIEATERELAAHPKAAARAMSPRLSAARKAFLEVVEFVVAHSKADPNAVFAGSVPYLMLAGNLMAGWQMARSLLAAESRLAEGQDVAFMTAKIATAQVYADHVLSRVPGQAESVVRGSQGILSMPVESF
jgi:hypothetical protein